MSEQNQTTAERIVVGVDGSDFAVGALAWALDEARLRHATLTVVHAWQYLPLVAEPLAAIPPIPFTELEDNAKQIVADTIEKAAGGQEPGVPLDIRVVEGPPAPALLDAAEGATMMVVGSRGRGGFAGLLLGSVSQQVTHHAPCPVVILPRSAQEHASAGD